MGILAEPEDGDDPMQITTPISEQLGRYLDLSGTELKLTAANMANVDTPGYRTKGLDFSGAMQLAIDEVNGGATQAGASTVQSNGIYEVDGLLQRPDGNNVSVDREGLKMAEAQLKFRTGIELLKHEFTRVLDAIHADAK